MAKVMEAKVRQASAAPESVPRQPEAIGCDGEGYELKILSAWSKKTADLGFRKVESVGIRKAN